MEMMLVMWAVGAVVVGVLAASRNRSGFAWCLLSLALTPLLMGLLVAVLRRGDDGLAAYTARTHRNCLGCMEVVRVDARKCKHCGSSIATVTVLPG